jgi:hypothetical protein
MSWVKELRRYFLPIPHPIPFFRQEGSQFGDNQPFGGAETRKARRNQVSLQKSLLDSAVVYVLTLSVAYPF